ncbi:MAG: PilZ domain-containing protein [Lachnospiraceae bacterium]
MEERRKNKRLGLETNLTLIRLDGDTKAEHDIEIIDVSKRGLGFTCKDNLEITGIYEGDLVIWTKEVMHVFLEIVRIEKLEDAILYGALFIGLPDCVTNGIEVYNAVQTYQQNIKENTEK